MELGAVVIRKAQLGRENMSMSVSVVVSDPGIMGGTPVFMARDTRVPVQTLMEYLEAGESINDFRVLQPIEKARSRFWSAGFVR